MARRNPALSLVGPMMRTAPAGVGSTGRGLTITTGLES